MFYQSIKEKIKDILGEKQSDKVRKIKENVVGSIVRTKENIINPFLVANKTKIFCIGQNKTGTTSLRQVFLDLNIVVGNQRTAENFLEEYLEGNFEPIIKYCKTGQFFQDFPFSFPPTYKYIDKAYPNSKFILSVRDNPEQWYNSVVNFHAKLFGNGHIPKKEDLQKAIYIREGYVWKSFSNIYKTPEDDLYNKDMMIDYYNKYNNEVIEYFADRPNDLAVINVSQNDDYKKLMNFLSIKSPFNAFPYKNKTNYTAK
ncbi:MAG: sulfotransferase [Alphaproteobacteria bacterium]